MTSRKDEQEAADKASIRAALEAAATGAVQADTPEDMSEDRAATVLDNIYRQGRQHRLRIGIVRWSATSAAMIIMVWGSMVLLRKKQGETAVVAQQQHPDTGAQILPGGNKAVLQLANGKTINLDDAHAGNIAEDGDAEIVKAGGGGALSYKALAQQQQALAYNTIATPRGGQYQVNLADGSKVWLNASSSLHFPTTFTGNDRTVELTGEGYFQIAKKAGAPFHVKINGTLVEVLGTSFNINGYNDEPEMRTTLVEGAVRVKAPGQVLLLKPGQQAISATAGTNTRLVMDANFEEELAWKNGSFNFNRLDLPTIMRQISRWYDVDVEYEGATPAGHFSGIIGRNTPIGTVLKLLEYGGVRFRMVGKKIVIMPN